MTKRSRIILIATMTVLLTAFLCTIIFNGKWLRTVVGGSGMSKSEAALRYPYQQLSRREQALYQTLCEGIAAYQEEIKLPDIYNQAEYERVYLMVCEQEPQFFYLDTVYETGAAVNLVRMHYDVPQDQIALMQAQIDLVADRIIEQSKSASTEFQKLLAIHDGVAAVCEYTEGEYQDEAYGCLVDGKAKCEGYAKALLYVARRAGMDIMSVTGVTGVADNHVWNIAKIDGEYYNVDVTWDDDSKYRGHTAHICFAVPDTMFADHRADLSAYQPPACQSDTASYYNMNGLVLHSAAELKPGIEGWPYDSMLMEFQFADEAVYQAVANEIATSFDLRNAVKIASGAANYKAVVDEIRRALVILPS